MVYKLNINQFIYTLRQHSDLHLWNDGDPGPEVLKPDLGDVLVVDADAAARRLQDTEQSQWQAGFTFTQFIITPDQWPCAMLH